MIDWENCKPEDFEIQVKGEEVSQTGFSLMFPVMVYHKDGDFAFTHNVPIRADFYNELKRMEGWQNDLMSIICKRVRDELNERLKKQAVSIHDKIDLINYDRQKI